jgi:Cupredoxin-like domain
MIKTMRVEVLIALLALTARALAGDPEYTIQLREHRFTPSEIKVPAGAKVKLIIENQDSTPEEFDSFALNREKIVFPNSKGIVFIGPLKPGRYEFIGEFNQSSAKGVVIAE